MLIDCTTCVARDVACGDCVISVLLAGPPPRRGPRRDERLTAAVPADIAAPVELDDAARIALGNLASAGLVPPLRLVAPVAAIAAGDEAAQLSGNDREIA